MTRRYNKPLHAGGKPPRPPVVRVRPNRRIATEPGATPLRFDSRWFLEDSGTEHNIAWREYNDSPGELTLAHFAADHSAYSDLESFVDVCFGLPPLEYPALPFPANPRPFEQSDYGRTACADLRSYFDTSVGKSHLAFVLVEEWNDRMYAFDFAGQWHLHWWMTSA